MKVSKRLFGGLLSALVGFGCMGQAFAGTITSVVPGENENPPLNTDNHSVQAQLLTTQEYNPYNIGIAWGDMVFKNTAHWDAENDKYTYDGWTTVDGGNKITVTNHSAYGVSSIVGIQKNETPNNLAVTVNPDTATNLAAAYLPDGTKSQAYTVSVTTGTATVPELQGFIDSTDAGPVKIATATVTISPPPPIG